MTKTMCNYFYVYKSGGGRYEESGVKMLDDDPKVAFNELTNSLCVTGAYAEIVISTFNKI